MAAHTQQCSPSLVVAAIRLVTSNSAIQHDPGTKQDFEHILLSRLKALKLTLAEEKRFEYLLRHLTRELDTSRFEFWNNFLTETTDIEIQCDTDKNSGYEVEDSFKSRVRWTFAEVCLQLIIVLKNLMQELGKQSKIKANQQVVDKTTNPTPGKTKVGTGAPKLSPDALSVSDQKTVLGCIQFIVSLGLCPNLLPGVGIPVEKRSEFSDVIRISQDCKHERHLYECVWTLLECIKHPMLGSIVLSRHLGDLLAGLLQICFAPPACYNQIGNTIQVNELCASNSMDKCNKKSTEQLLESRCNEFNEHNKPKSLQKIGEKATFVKTERMAQSSQITTSRSRKESVAIAWEAFLSFVNPQYRDWYISASQREDCWSELHRLLDRVYPPMMVRELIILQGGGGKRQTGAQKWTGKGTSRPQEKSNAGPPTVENAAEYERMMQRSVAPPRTPKWFVKICGQLLSEQLMKPNGVQAVLRGILETPGDPGSTPDWRKCDMVAKLVANSPSQAQSVDDYYAHVAPQILGLLHLSSAGLGYQFIRVASSTIQLMMKLHPVITRKHVLDNMMGPLARTTSHQVEVGDSSKVVSDETSLTRCVEDIHKVFVAGADPSSSALSHLSDVVHPLFEMFCFTRKGISHLRSSCQEILAQFLKHSSSASALKTLYILAFKDKPPENFGDVLKVESHMENDKLGRQADNEETASLNMHQGKPNEATSQSMSGNLQNEVHGKDVARNTSLATETHKEKLSELGSSCKKLEEQTYRDNAGRTTDNIVQLGEDSCMKHQEQADRNIRTKTSYKVNTSDDTSGPKSSDVRLHKTEVESAETQTKLMHNGYIFSHGDSGGVAIKFQGDIYQSSEASANDVLGRLFGDAMMEHEVRALCLVELLGVLKRDRLAGEFFLHLMQELTGIISDKADDVQDKQEELLSYDRSAAEQQRSLLILHLVALMCAKLGPDILQNTQQMLAFIRSTLQRGSVLCREDQHKEGLISETLTMAFGMLSAVLGGAVELNTQDREIIKEFIPLLETLALQNPDTEVGAMATDLRIAIATHGAVWSQQLKDAAGKLGKRDPEKRDDAPSSTAYDEAFSQLCDPLVPVRGHAMLALASLLNNRDPKAISQIDTLTRVFEEQLAHEDSYIYLAAVQGLVALAGIRPDPVLPHLARQFATCRKEAGNESKQEGLYSPNKEKHSPSPSPTPRSPELRMKLGEALVRATRACGPMLPRYSQHLLASLLTGVRDPEPMVRASSLSNLGEVCRLLRFSLGPIIHEIFSCLSAVLNSDKSEHVRRAAVPVITQILRGLAKDSIQVLGSNLREIYHLLKLVEARDPDETTRIHAQVALGELDGIMRESLFPKPTFTKKIQVLP